MRRVLALAAGGAALGGAACEDPTNPGGPPAVVTIVGGNNQTAVAGTELPAPLTVRVTTSGGAPVSGAEVEWTVVSGGGSFATPRSSTDADGRAQARFTLGPTPGANAMRGTVAGTTLSGEFGAVGTDPPGHVQ